MPGFIEPVNVPSVIATLVSAKIATLADLQTVYSIEDAYDLLEILGVDSHNQRRMHEHYSR